VSLQSSRPYRSCKKITMGGKGYHRSEDKNVWRGKEETSRHTIPAREKQKKKKEVAYLSYAMRDPGGRGPLSRGRREERRSQTRAIPLAKGHIPAVDGKVSAPIKESHSGKKRGWGGGGGGVSGGS